MEKAKMEELIQEYGDGFNAVNDYTQANGISEVVWEDIMACFHCEHSSFQMEEKNGKTRAESVSCGNSDSSAFKANDRDISPRYQLSRVNMQAWEAAPDNSKRPVRITFEEAFRGCERFELKKDNQKIPTVQSSKVIPIDSLLRKQKPEKIFADYKEGQEIFSPSFDSIQFLQVMAEYSKRYLAAQKKA